MDCKLCNNKLKKEEEGKVICYSCARELFFPGATLLIKNIYFFLIEIREEIGFLREECESLKNDLKANKIIKWRIDNEL